MCLSEHCLDFSFTMKESKEDIPPNSRLFVLHGKNTTREELQEAFEKFGKIEDIWMVRDRESHELKGKVMLNIIFKILLQSCMFKMKYR